MPKKKIESTEVETQVIDSSAVENIEETVEQPVEVDAVEETVEEVKEEPKAEKKAKKTASNKVENKEAKEAPSERPNKKHGKKYRNVVDLVEKGKEYEISEAIELLKKTATPKFDSTVEIHVNLNVDPTNADHQVRGSVLMPAGLGKSKKIAVIANPDKEKEAKEAGADIVGGQELVEKIEKGFMDFEVVVATPDMMASVGKIGKILGTKGLMPNPKTGTVTNDVAKVVGEIKKRSFKL